jgi:hypothetical protein
LLIFSIFAQKNIMTLNELVESNNFKAFAKKIEILSGALSVLGAFLVLLKVEFSQVYIILILGYFSLSFIYVALSFRKFNSEDKIAKYFFKIYYWGLAITALWVGFTLLHLPTSILMVPIAAILILASLFLGLKYKTEEHKDQINFIYFARLIIAIVLLVGVFLVRL